MFFFVETKEKTEKDKRNGVAVDAALKSQSIIYVNPSSL